MESAQRPQNESERLAVLKRLNILDTDPEKTFDDIVALASRICGTQISLISLVDANRQWFKAKTGVNAEETPREVAFCAHAILDDEIMIVEDARADDRFADNPLVTELPKIRFYAGMPLQIEDNVNIGTLCVIDQKPKQLSKEQLESLRVLGRAVVAHMRLNRLDQVWPGIGKRQTVCAWCLAVRTEVNGVETWRPLHEYVADIERVSHGMCPACAAKQTGE
ncbi:MAG: GAF domain-containing protein [Woeseiaceae bacterium]|nr:GAF domain-containing protein [Woeseiaceae bacterium]